MPHQAKIENKKELVEKVTALIIQIDQMGDVPDEIVKQPGEFFRELFEAWYSNGGLVGGRPRNSIRRMRNEWLIGESAVPSLHPKLQGEVKLGRRDGRILVNLFLERWEYVGSRRKDAAVTLDGYVPFPSKDLERLAGTLLDTIFGLDDGEPNTTILLPSTGADDDESHLAVEDYKAFVQEADAIIFVSSKKTILAPRPQEGMRTWWHLVNNFSKEEKTRNNAFIWVIDIGSRQAEDEGSFAHYYNAGVLALHFTAFANFGSALDRDRSNAGPISQRLSLPDDRKRLARWQWLREHAVIVIQSRGHSEIEALYKKEDEHLRTMRLQHDRLNVEYILPRTIPSTWAKPLEELYKSKFNDLEDATLSVTYKRMDKQGINVHYLAAANLAKENPSTSKVDEEAWNVDTVHLPSPGKRYDEAYHLLYYASIYRLKEKKDNLDENFAMAFLKRSGFEILRVDEFIKIFGIIENLPSANAD